MLLAQIAIAIFLTIIVSYFVYNYVREKQTQSTPVTVEMEDPVVEEQPFIEPEIKQVKPKSAPRKRSNKKKSAGNKPAVKTKK